MAKRRIKQVNRCVVWYNSGLGEYYVTDLSGRVLKDEFESQKDAESYCKSPKPTAKETTSLERWGTVAMQVLEKLSKEDLLMAVPAPKEGTRTAPVPVPKEGTYSHDLAGIYQLFEDRIGVADENTKERLAQYYRDFEHRKQPAYERVAEAICITSTKVRVEQRSIAYAIGIMKKWLDYGYGNNVQEEHRKLMMYFEKTLNVKMSEAARTKMMALISTYGIVDIMATLFTLDVSAADISAFYVDLLDFKINETFQQQS